jgi:hypothetical protein
MEVLATFVFWLVPATIYFGPSIVAITRSHYRVRYIIAVNLLLGWTVVGLFIAFAWALSSTRPMRKDEFSKPTTDFGERLYQNRNIVRRSNGGAMVYPAYLTDEAYELTAQELLLFYRMRAAAARRNYPRGLIILFSCIGLFLGFRAWLGPEHGTAPALLTSTALAFLIASWDLVIWPKREFRTRFPKAPRVTDDPLRRKRRVLATLIAFDPLICVGATLLCLGLIISMALQAALYPHPITVRAHDASILLTGLSILIGGCTYYGHLTWHHVVFFMKNRRRPVQEDVDKLAHDRECRGKDIPNTASAYPNSTPLDIQS